MNGREFGTICVSRRLLPASRSQLLHQQVTAFTYRCPVSACFSAALCRPLCAPSIMPLRLVATLWNLVPPASSTQCVLVLEVIVKILELCQTGEMWSRSCADHLACTSDTVLLAAFLLGDSLCIIIQYFPSAGCIPKLQLCLRWQALASWSFRPHL